MALPSAIRERLTLPAVAAPMFLCSGVELAIEVCKAGLIGSLTRNHCRDLEELEAQLKTVQDALVRFHHQHPDRKVGPLAVNISPTFGADEFRAHLQACRRYGASIVITSVGDPTANAPLIHDEGLLTGTTPPRCGSPRRRRRRAWTGSSPSAPAAAAIPA